MKIKMALAVVMMMLNDSGADEDEIDIGSCNDEVNDGDDNIGRDDDKDGGIDTNHGEDNEGRNDGLA